MRWNTRYSRKYMCPRMGSLLGILENEIYTRINKKQEKCHLSRVHRRYNQKMTYAKKEWYQVTYGEFWIKNIHNTWKYRLVSQDSIFSSSPFIPMSLKILEMIMILVIVRRMRSMLSSLYAILSLRFGSVRWEWIREWENKYKKNYLHVYVYYFIYYTIYLKLYNFIFHFYLY